MSSASSSIVPPPSGGAKPRVIRTMPAITTASLLHPTTTTTTTFPGVVKPSPETVGHGIIDQAPTLSRSTTTTTTATTTTTTVLDRGMAIQTLRALLAGPAPAVDSQLWSPPPSSSSTSTPLRQARLTQVPEPWQAWLHENLAQSPDYTQLVPIMVEQHGFTHRAVWAAILHILEPPLPHFTYVKAKWTLDLLQAMDELDTRPRRLAERHGPVSSLTEFRQTYVAHNLPVVWRQAVTDIWPAWDVTFFERQLAGQQLQVQTRRSTDPSFELNSISHREMLPMEDFLQRLRTGPANDVYLTANNARANRALFAPYLSQLAQLGPVDDPWLDLSAMPDRSFLWLGTRDTFTPNHHDLTNNALVQLTGHKRVWLAPPHATSKLYNAQAVFSPVQPRDGPAATAAQFPAAKSVRWTEVELGPGDLLFLPEGWWHSVLGLDENVSVTFTCFASGVPHFPASW